jgi:hypothetical protein
MLFSLAIHTQTRNTKMSEFCFSVNGEDFFQGEYPTRAEALHAAIATKRLGAGDVVEIGGSVPWDTTEFFPDPLDLIQEIQRKAVEEVGDVAEDWLENVSEVAAAELNASLEALLASWIEKHKLAPTFFRVVDIEKHEVCPQEVP